MLNLILLVVKKEFRQNVNALLVLLAVAAFFPCAILFLPEADNVAHSSMQEQLALNLSISLIISCFSPSFVGYILMAAERTKRTLLVLRMFPINTGVIIGGKEIFGFITILVILATNIISFYASFHFLNHIFLPLVPFWWLVDGVIMLFILLQFSLWMFLRFELKWATQIPFLVAGLAFPALLTAQHVPPINAAILKVIFYLVAPAGCAFMYLLHWAMCKEFDRQDWTMPTEE